MLGIRPRERPLWDALGLGVTALDLAEQRNTPVFGVSLVQSRAVILGAMQRTGCVINANACARKGVGMMRRLTTGPAAFLDGSGLILTLALPHVAAIYEDATNRTLLNRNVRPFLHAFNQASVMAHYFGREWISLRKSPAALIGFDMTRTGAVLIEVILGADNSIALPKELQAVTERKIDRFMGKTAVGLREIVPDIRLETFVEKVVETIVDPVNASSMEVTSPGAVPADDMDPWCRGYVLKKSVRVPIGYLEVGVSHAEGLPSWCLGGDVLAPRWLYADIASGMGQEKLAPAPIEGATLEDMIRVVAESSIT